MIRFLSALALAPLLHAALPVVDLSQDTKRHVNIAQGTEKVYQGHPTTLLMPDGKTMFCVWTHGHGGTAGPLKRSDDAGKTWSEELSVPENWWKVKNCPAIYRLTDPQGVTRLIVYAGQGPDGTMQQSVSTDEGKTWSPMQSNGLVCVMPFCSIIQVEGGKKLIGLSNIRRPGETKDKKSNVVTQSESTDGGLTWSPWRILVDLGDLKPCEPEVLRSPDGKQLLCLIRENIRTEPAHFITSEDEGKTWSAVKALPPGLHGDRHKAVYAKDGRLVIAFRDTGLKSPTKNHFVAWVGRYEDIINGKDGEYKIKLLHSHKASDCGYPGLELLPDGTIVATTYIKYRPGAEQNSVVCTRFKLAETDKTEMKIIGAAKPALAAHAGIVVDDAEARYVGTWVESTKQKSFVGIGYRHDENRDQGLKTAIFTPKITQAGDYEVRLIYAATNNRATNAKVSIAHANGTAEATLNEREECFEGGVPRSVGRFRFEAGKTANVTLSNEGADGFVVVDAVQLVPVALADDERNGIRESGFKSDVGTARNEDTNMDVRATAVAVMPLTKIVPGKDIAPPSKEPVMLTKDIGKPAEHYDVVVIGGTASGVACAVRAAREGCSVLLVQHNRHIGGMLANGLMQWDALYGGHRAAIFTELLQNIEKDAIARFGKDSKSHQIIKYTHGHYPIGWVEPHVMERECHRLIAGEKNLSLLLERHSVKAERDGAVLKSITLNSGETVKADIFVDATYEGDLLPLAKVAYRVGREARDEYGEPHAGKVFTNIDPHPPESVKAQGMNLRGYGQRQGKIDPTSPFTADGNSQAYNYRFCVTKDPANRVMLTAPPPGYDRDEYVNYDRKSIATNGGPNLKSHMNSPILPGENAAYPEASWEERQKIIDRHKNFGLGLIWFLQNDESMKSKWAQYREWGLAKDEFPDNGHIPHEMYVREARRLVGRHVLTEHDGMLAKDYARVPIHADSIAVTDWYMDSHSCTTDSRPGFKYDGKLILTEESRPMQVPYRAMLPKDIDNLLVPVCLSSTHIAWGALRLEPVWMQTGEAAGWAAALSKKHQTTPGKLDAKLLVRTLVDNRQLVSFFNNGLESPAVQYFGTQGYFATYDAKLDEPLTEGVKVVWEQTFADPRKRAEAVAKAEKSESTSVGQSRGDFLFKLWQQQ